MIGRKEIYIKNNVIYLTFGCFGHSSEGYSFYIRRSESANFTFIN